ncbi:MAG: hypothetical protein V7727_21775 [Sneathiella sp.]
MSFSFPLPLPTVTGVSALNNRPSVAEAISISPFTKSQEILDYQGQLLEYDVSVPAMERDAAEEWKTFFLMLDGSSGTFLMRPDDVYDPRGVATGVPVVAGADQKGKSLITSGWTVSTTNILRKGDCISLGTGESTRLHKVLTDTDSDVSGNATLDIWPQLRSSPTDLAVIDVSILKGVFNLTSGIPAISLGVGGIYKSFSFSCREFF